METNCENGADALKDETRQKLKDLSKTMLRLHKSLLESEKAVYEAKNGKIRSPNQYLALVIDDAHFAWLRKISALIALIDESVSIRHPATETNARALLDGAKLLLSFEDDDVEFNDQFQSALQDNADAILNYNHALTHLA